MGTSPREDALKSASGNINAQLPGLQNGTNLSNFKFQFNPEDITAALDKMLGSQTQQLQTQAGDLGATLAKNTTARMASQGVTGGSLVNSQVNAGQVGINKNLQEALTSLLTNRAGQQVGVMNNANTQGMQLASARSNALNGMLGMGLQGAAMQPNDTWLTDALGILNTGANLVNPLSKLFSGGSPGSSGGGGGT